MEDTAFLLVAEQVPKSRLHTCIMCPQYVHRPSACKFKDRPSYSQRRKSTWGRGKEGEGETDRRWLSWADIFWEPVLRLPGAIFKRPTSPHSPGGCRGERRGLLHVNTGAPHVAMSHDKRLTQHAQTKVRPEAARTGMTTDPRTMLLISIHGPLFLSAAPLLPLGKETLPPIGDTRKHIPQNINLNSHMCHRVHLHPTASIFQID